MIDVKSITNQIINADCMDILKQLPDKCIDLVLTDPPYGIGNKFKGGTNSKLNKFNNIVNKGWDNAPSEKQFREHPTQKPLKLFEMILRDYSNENDLILDCFSGSGTTAVACHNLKRRFICIEKDKDYYEKSVERLNIAQAQLRFDFGA